MATGPESVLGTWKITECAYSSQTLLNPAPPTVQGATFTLLDSGELLWDLPKHVDSTCPLFECDCFEVVCSFVGTCIQMGTVSGHILEFYVDRPPFKELMKLTCEGWCTFTCIQAETAPSQLDFPYSFLPAFQEGFFSDLTLEASQSNSSGITPAIKKFMLHSVILELSNVKLEDLSGLPEDILQTLLFFLYTQCLPSDLTLELANKCISAAPPCMNQFIHMCEDYVYRITLRNRITRLVNEIHLYADKMLNTFQNHEITKPGKFCQVVKIALKHALVATFKLVEVCAIYGEEASKLHPEEKVELLRYAKTRLPLLLNQFVALLRTVKTDFSAVKPSDRTSIAGSIVPEVESILESLSNLMLKARDACAKIESRWSTRESRTQGFRPSPFLNFTPDEEAAQQGSSSSHDKPRSDFTESLYSVFHEREIQWLHNACTQIHAFSAYISQRKEIFEEMLPPSKIRCISRNLEQLIEELPVFLLRLEEIMIALDDRFQWKDFRFCLQQAISQVCHALDHLRQERKTLHHFFIALNEMVQSDDFYESLLNLNLIGNEECIDRKRQSSAVDNEKLATPKNASTAEHTPVHPTADLFLVNMLCTPPKSRMSVLAINAAALFGSAAHSDMIFVVHHESETIEIPSHRAIIASRCDWFRRALLSGMKESVQKRIVIHDCPIPVFYQFLQYIYTGNIGEDSFTSTECLCDLSALADRYEVDELKLSCEQELIQRHVDENSVVFLLTVADQFNARSLRRSCLQYIASNPGVMAKDVFEELTPELQMEVYDITMWSKANRRVFSTVDELVPYPRYVLVPDMSSSSSSDSELSSTAPP